MRAFTPPQLDRHSMHPRINPHISVIKKRDQGTIWAIGIIIAIIAVVAFLALWKGADANELILNVIGLRQGPGDVVKRSALITRTNQIVADIGNKRIRNDWDSLSECMSRQCSDIDYYNFLVTVVTQKKVRHSELIYNLILVNKYWGTSEIIDFSQAMTTVNKNVEDLGSREVQKQWNAIIQCDAKCPEKDDQFFSMIKLVVMAG